MNEIYVLGERHHLIFGTIVQHFARFERLVEVAIARILGAQFPLVAIVVSGLGYSAKCEALTSLLGVVSGPAECADAITSALAEFKKYVPLRNAIAHHPWKEGTRPQTIKHLSVSSRGGKAIWRGMEDDDRDYTIDELIDIADRLLETHDKLVAYFVETGLMEKAVFDTAPASSSKEE